MRDAKVPEVERQSAWPPGLTDAGSSPLTPAATPASTRPDSSPLAPAATPAERRESSVSPSTPLPQLSPGGKGGGGATADDARQAVARLGPPSPPGATATRWTVRDPRGGRGDAQRRDEMAGIMIREAGKPWREADADTCEAIDFCEYYARRAVGLFQPRAAGPVCRRAEPSVVRAARRGLGHQPVELPLGDLHAA